MLKKTFSFGTLSYSCLKISRKGNAWLSILLLAITALTISIVLMNGRFKPNGIELMPPKNSTLDAASTSKPSSTAALKPDSPTDSTPGLAEIWGWTDEELKGWLSYNGKEYESTDEGRNQLIKSLQTNKVKNVVINSVVSGKIGLLDEDMKNLKDTLEDNHIRFSVNSGISK